MTREYAIWGIPPKQEDETLLVAMPNGKPITSRKEAERLMALLATKHGCRNCRIQCIDGRVPNFVIAVE